MEEIIRGLAGGVVLTLEITAGAWILATAAGLVMASIVELRIPALRALTVLTIDVSRAVPELIVLYLVYFGLGAAGVSVSPLLAAIVAIGLGEAGFTAEMFRAGLTTVGPGQREAGHSLGMSEFSIYQRIVLPQTVPFMIPPLVNSFSSLLKVATYASVIGVNEVLGRANILMANTGEITTVLSVAIVIYLILTVPVSEAVSYLERRLRAR